MDKRISLLFQAPYQIVIEESAVPEPQAGEVLVTARFSAISPGTEMLFYRGQVPAGMVVDDTIDALAGEIAYPLEYGYALVGSVTAVGAGVDQAWLGREVFVFAPHQSHVICPVEALLVVPEGLSARDAVLLPFMETAVSFLMDGEPLIGEQAVVLGQGIIGLLVTALLSDYPLSALVTVDRFPLRRDWSLPHISNNFRPRFRWRRTGAPISSSN
jgi:2-desacetyl-2-hydroxyethyl bacteriochlorophyllide A dehydrogenase